MKIHLLSIFVALVIGVVATFVIRDSFAKVASSLIKSPPPIFAQAVRKE